MKRIFTVRFLFIAAIIALSSFSFLSYKRIELLMVSSKMVTHATQVKLELEKLINALKDAEAGQRGYLLTHDKRFLEPFNNGLQAYPQHFISLKELTSGNAEQQKNLKEVEVLAQRRVNYMFSMLQIDKTRTPTAEQMLGGKQIMDSLHAAINKMEDAESNMLRARNAELKRQSVITPLWLLFFYDDLAGNPGCLFPHHHQANKGKEENGKKRKRTATTIQAGTRNHRCLSRRKSYR